MTASWSSENKIFSFNLREVERQRNVYGIELMIDEGDNQNEPELV